MFPSKADRKAQNRVGNRLRFLQHAARLRKGIFDPRPDPACRPLKRRQSPGPLCASEAVRAQLFPGFDLDPLPPGLDRLLEGPARGQSEPRQRHDPEDRPASFRRELRDGTEGRPSGAGKPPGLGQSFAALQEQRRPGFLLSQGRSPGVSARGSRPRRR